MADRMLHRCLFKGCPALIPARDNFCPRHRKIKQQERNALHDPFYSTKRWQKCRAAVLAQEPICRVCGRPANTVDHITPRRKGGADYERDNLQALCAECHARKGRG